LGRWKFRRLDTKILVMDIHIFLLPLLHFNGVVSLFKFIITFWFGHAIVIKWFIINSFKCFLYVSSEVFIAFIIVVFLPYFSAINSVPFSLVILWLIKLNKIHWFNFIILGLGLSNLIISRFVNFLNASELIYEFTLPF